MRFIALVLSLCFSLNVMATPISAFEEALDTYQYDLTVAWDQKDQSVFTSRTQSFYQEMNDLMASGLTSEQILKVLETKVKDPKQLDEIRARLTIQKATSEMSLANLIAEQSKNFYSTGASWDGYVYLSIGGGVILAAIIGYSIWWDTKHVCVETAQGQQCGWVSQYPGGPQFYQCWNTTYCTRYEDK